MQDAAGAGARAQKKYFSPNMVVCLAEKIVYERIAEELSKQEYWKAVTGIQKLDFHHRYVVAFSPILPRLFWSFSAQRGVWYHPL